MTPKKRQTVITAVIAYARAAVARDRLRQINAAPPGPTPAMRRTLARVEGLLNETEQCHE